MNNEPVAWIIDVNMTDCGDNFIWNTGDYPDWQVKDWIPLYTHPAEEIIEKNKPEIEKANAYIKSLEDEIEALRR